MQEWLLIRIFTKNIHLHDKLWSFFAKVTGINSINLLRKIFLHLLHSIYFQSIKHRPRCTISVASIVYHVAKLLSCDNQKTFIQTALPYIVQCCLGQQFNARVYNQASEILKHELKNMCIKIYINKYIFHNSF